MVIEPDRGEDAEALVLLLIQLDSILGAFGTEHDEIRIVAHLTVAQARGAYRELLRLLMGDGPYTEPPFELRFVPPVT